MKKIMFVMMASSAILFACEGNKTSTENNDGHEHEHAAGDAEHVHSYTCPMHPEVVSDKPGKCPKCGMDLEHTDHVADDGKKFVMVFKSEPEKIEAGKPAKLKFKPAVEGDDNALVPLDVVHEKKLHLLIMSKDLSYFAHEHPDYSTDNFYVWQHTFPEGGEYVMFQDYNPSGSGHQLGKQTITVAGTPAKTVKYSEEKLSWRSDGYKIDLSADKMPLQKNTSVELTVNITKNGKPVTDLQNYLGALGHMVVVSEDTEEYLHVHPMESKENGPEIHFHSNFPKAGIYRVFLQIQHNGKIITSNFTVKVS